MKSLSRVVLIGLLLNTSNSTAGGFSEGQQASFLDSLSGYQRVIKSKKVSKEWQDFQCGQEGNFPHSKECLERKFMSNGYYKVSIAFSVNHTASETLPAKFPSGSWAYEGEALEAFLNKWSAPVLSEYLGSDYTKFHSVKLASLNNEYVRVELLVSDASELEELVRDPRIAGGSHIGRRPGPIEEIAD